MAQRRIQIVCPAPKGTRHGNRVSAERWARLLCDLGFATFITDTWHGQRCDLLLALHARKSHDSIREFRKQHPTLPIILVLTGTDLYRDLARSAKARTSLEWADRLVVLQHLASRELPTSLHHKVRVIYQSVLPTRASRSSENKTIQLAILGHLRQVKDPLRPGMALRHLPDLPNLRVIQAGEERDKGLGTRARALMQREPRYTWLGDLARPKAQKLLATSDVLIIPSRMEGGANVVSEAIVNGIPVLASNIPGNLGLLGEDYPAVFPVGDTKALAALMRRFVDDPEFRADLRRRVRKQQPLFTPKRESQSWKKLLDELCIGGA